MSKQETVVRDKSVFDYLYLFDDVHGKGILAY